MLNQFPRAINFSLSNACSANCLFCPTDRGRKSQAKFMELEVFKAVFQNLTTNLSCQEKANLIVRVGENGDLFLNPDFVRILKEIRHRVPEAKVELYNHFFLFSPEISEILIKQSLVDSIFTNIDGIDENYFQTKSIPFKRTFDNLKFFLEKRRKEDHSQISLNVRVLTHAKYCRTVFRNFGVWPAKYNPNHELPKDDYNEVSNLLKPILDNRLDTFSRSSAVLWAERGHISISKSIQKAYSCPQMFRIESEVFVSPEGKWYLCCLDSKQELVIGDLCVQPFSELVVCEDRRNFLKFLKSKAFAKVGGPCNSVHCCQVYSEQPFVSRLLRIMARYPKIVNLFFLLHHG